MVVSARDRPSAERQHCVAIAAALSCSITHTHPYGLKHTQEPHDTAGKRNDITFGNSYGVALIIIRS